MVELAPADARTPYRPTADVWSAGHRQLSRLISVTVFAVVPLAFAAVFVYRFSTEVALGFDFRGTVWEPTRALLSGTSPFPAPTAEALEHVNAALYPPAVALLGLPFAALPFTVAAVLWIVASTLSVVASLRLVGARDWRCYSLALSSLPVMAAISFGNVTPVLMLAVALAWRFRDRLWVVAPAVAGAVALKLFLWPLVVWLIATRRFRSASVAVAVAAAAILAPWAVIGFAGLVEYPALLSVAEDVFGPHSNSVIAGALGAGASEAAARVIAYGLGSLLLVAVVVTARRAEGDWRAFTGALAAALVLSPIVWAHYFALLLVVLAVVQPRLSWSWAAAPAFLVGYWLAPFPAKTACCPPEEVPAVIWRGLHSDPALWPAVALWSVAAFILLASVVRTAKTPTGAG